MGIGLGALVGLSVACAAGADDQDTGSQAGQGSKDAKGGKDAKDAASDHRARGGAAKKHGGAKERSGRGHGRGHGRGEKGAGEVVVTVEMTALQRTDVARYYKLSGTLKALRRAQLRPVQSGILVSVLAEEGDEVKAKQLLARLDGRERSLMAVRDDISSRNARQELQRLETIVSQHVLSREELDKQRFALESAVANAKISRHQAGLNLVRAPFAGTIIARNLDVGNLATSGDVLFEIADVSVLELELHVPEREASRVAKGASAIVELLDESRFDAVVVRCAPIVDPLTGTVKLTLRAKAYPPTAVPGAFARAQILMESHENVPSLPRTAVFEVEGRPHVYAVMEGKARRRLVQLGLRGRDRVEIAGGLDPGVSVVVGGATDITDGMALKPIEATGSTSANTVAAPASSGS